MKSSHLSLLILRLKKQKNKLIYVEQIKHLCAEELGAEYTDKKCYKLIYHLKNKGYLVSLKKEIFFITNPDRPEKESVIIDQRYRSILHHHCMHAFTKRYIGGLKALELHAGNTDVPEQILVINATKQTTDSVVTNKHLHAKTYTHKKKQLFAEFAQYTRKHKIGKLSFPLACKELAILECLFGYDATTDRYTYEYIKKLLKKHELDLEIIEDLLRLGKHHTSVNRLVELLKTTSPELVKPLMQLIKKYSFVLNVS